MAETLLVPLITEQGGKDIQHEEYEDIPSGAVGRTQGGRAKRGTNAARPPAVKGSLTAPTPRSSPAPSAETSQPSTSSGFWRRPTEPRMRLVALAPCSGGRACTPLTW